MKRDKMGKAEERMRDRAPCHIRSGRMIGSCSKYANTFKA